MPENPCRERLVSLGGVFDGHDVAIHYGQIEAEYHAVQNAVGLIDRSHRARLSLRGKDHVAFLNNMVTNDIKTLKSGDGLYACLLNAKGRMITDMKVYRWSEDELILDLEMGLGEAIRELLLKHRFMSDVTIVNLEDSLAQLSLYGPQSMALLNNVLGVNAGDLKKNSSLRAEYKDQELLIVSSTALNLNGYELYIPSSLSLELLDSFLSLGERVGLKLFGETTFETVRIESGIPKYGVDMTESTIPLEAKLDHAISFTKGCYIGQETVTRMKHRGHPNWYLVGLTAKGDCPLEAGASLIHDGKDVGQLTSATYSPACQTRIALGYVRREYQDDGTKLRIASVEGDHEIEVTALPFS